MEGERVAENVASSIRDTEQVAISRSTNASPSETRILEEQLYQHLRAGGEDPPCTAASQRSSDTKRRFRAARGSFPGAIASSPSNSTSTTSTGTNGNASETSAFVPSFSVSFEGRNSRDSYSRNTNEELFNDGSTGASYPPRPRTITAEVVNDGRMMDLSERRRIVQETIQTISDQTVEAEVLHHGNNKSSREYLTFVLVLICILIGVVVILVVVLATRTSGFRFTPTDVVATPTSSPTMFIDDSVFRTTEELYQAVDIYRMLTWNMTNASLFEASDVAFRYGSRISSWNVTLITNFSRVFDPIRLAPDQPWKFNEDLGDWDVSNAETMMGMFMNAYDFQGIGLENWNVGKVKDFSFMFMSSGFNGSIAGWNTSNAESMNSMFRATYGFNTDLSTWNVSGVQSMNAMFHAASMFQGIGLEYWNVQRVRDFSSMFSGAIVFNGTLSGWDTSSAETMEEMFNYAAKFNDDLSLWDVSKVSNMMSMFYSSSEYTGDGIASWDVSKVVTMNSMFTDAVLFNGDVSHWDVSRLSSLSSMFYNAGSFNQNLSTWNVSGVRSMTYVFNNAVHFNGDVSSWDVSNVNDFTSMFYGCADFDGNLSLWNTRSANHMNGMFAGTTKFTGRGLSNWDTSFVYYFDYMFRDAVSFSEDLSLWDVSNAQNMANMFESASSFNSDISQWNVSSLLDASYMFSDASSFNYSLCPWNEILPPEVSLDRVFIGSDCDDTSDPTINGTSFCGFCNE